MPLFWTTSTPFCRYKTSNFLVTHCFYGRIVVCAYPIFCRTVFMFALIFHCRSFSPCWPLAFLIVSQPLWIFMFFFLQNSSLLFSVTRSSSFSVIHVSVNIKNNVEKDTTLLLFFSFWKFRRPCNFFPNKTLHLGCHTCWLNYFTLVCLWCGRTVGWPVGVRSRDYQIFSDWWFTTFFLPVVLRCAHFARESFAINKRQCTILVLFFQTFYSILFLLWFRLC